MALGSSQSKKVLQSRKSYNPVNSDSDNYSKIQK